MKIHNDFTLYFRVVPSGKRVVYYYAYDENGKRLCGRSTGESTITAARVKCNRLLKLGALIPAKDRVPTFAEYAKGWWEWENCDYLKKRRKRLKLTQGYAVHAKRNMVNMLIPYFGDMPMDKITEADVEKFLDYLIGKKQLKNSTANDFLTTLKTMMIEAATRRIITIDPTKNVAKLIKEPKKIQLITPEEFKKLFVLDWEKVWNNNRIGYTANKLAALTGMRTAEVLGLKGCYVYDKHIYLCMQYDSYGYRETKTKDKTNIPLPVSMIDDLNELKKTNGDGFLFSTDGGAVPICRVTMYREFQRALRNIGMTDEVIAERGLTLHGWRHFLNTELLKGGLSIPQTQAVTRHKSDRMTEWYSHFDPTEFAKAVEVQEGLLSLEKPVEKTSAESEKKQAESKEKQRVNVLPFPAKKNERTGKQRKQA